MSTIFTTGVTRGKTSNVDKLSIVGQHQPEKSTGKITSFTSGHFKCCLIRIVFCYYKKSNNLNASKRHQMSVSGCNLQILIQQSYLFFFISKNVF